MLFEDRALSYAALEAHANRLAHHLQSRGVGPDVLVGVLAERSLEMVVGLLGILKAGGAYLPLDPKYPRERLSGMVADADLSVVLLQEAFAAALPLPEGVCGIVLDAGALSGTHDGLAVDAPALEALQPAHLATMIYTRARPAAEGRRSKSRMQDAYGLGGDDVVLQKTPFSFDVSVWEFFWPLIVGSRLVMAPPGAHRDPARLLAAIHEHGVTTLHFVPSMLQAFIEHVALEQAARDRTPAEPVSSVQEETSAHACASLRRIICSGEALPAELRDQVARHLPRVQLENLYGPTEASIDVTRWACGGDRSREVPIGRPIWNTRAYVLDGGLEPVPSGVVGELYIAGVGLARGYLAAFGSDGGAVCGRPAWRAAWVGGRADVPDRGPGAVAWRRGAGVSGAGRCAGEAARVPDRAWRDRGCAAAAAGVSQAVVVARADGGSGPRLVGYVVAAAAAEGGAFGRG